MGLIKRGYNTSGHVIGILMLDTAFPRIVGDIGNAATFHFPVLYRKVPGATVPRLVEECDPALLTPFIEGAIELESAGVKAITTGCGFLAIFQKELSAAVSIPVFSSSLMLVPLIYRMLAPGKKVGILTASKKSLGERHFNGVGWSSKQIPIAVEGLEDCPEFNKMVFQNATVIDFAKVEEEVLCAGKRLLEKCPDVGAVVMECTNLPPYAPKLRYHLGVPVFDILSLVRMVHAAVLEPPSC